MTVTQPHPELCTCSWLGGEGTVRPDCCLHEGGRPPRGFARRSDGRVVDVAATVGSRRRTGGLGTWSDDISSVVGVRDGFL